MWESICEMCTGSCISIHLQKVTFKFASTIFVFILNRTFNIWNQANSHPLFAESDARYHSISLAKMRKLLYIVVSTTCFSAVGMWPIVNRHAHRRSCIDECFLFEFSAWTTITFFGDSVKGQFNRETNETEYVEIPRLPIKAAYPWNSMSGVGYMSSFGFQVEFSVDFAVYACRYLMHIVVQS